MYKFIYTVFICCSLTFAYAQPTVPTYRIDPAKAYGGNISDYFTEIEYIPLETTKESLFGDIHQLVITDSSIAILDNDTQSTLFFSLDGRFIKKIKPRNGFYPVVLYKSSENNKIIIGFINAADQPKITTYTSMGNYIGNIDFSRRLIDQFQFANIENKFFFEFNSFKKSRAIQKDSINHLINVFHADTLYKQLLPYHISEKAAFLKIGGELTAHGQQNFNNNTFYAATSFENTIYKISKDTAIAVLQIIFPKDYVVDPQFLLCKNNSFIDSVVTNNSYRGSNLIYSISSIHFFNNKIFLRTQATGFSGRPSPNGIAQGNFIYDLKSNKTFSLERITPDKTSYFLPIVNQEKTTRDGIILQGNTMFTSLSSLQLFTAYNNTKSKKPQYPPALQTYFATQNRKSNPVIVRMKLKE